MHSSPPEAGRLGGEPRAAPRAANVLAAVGVDGASATALARADQLARALDARLTVLHVVPSRRTFAPLTRETPADLARATPLVRACVEPLRRWVQSLLTRRVEEGALVLGHGPVGGTLIDAIDELAPDVVVMGSGKLSYRLARTEQRPLLVARPPATTTQIVALTDFSDPSFPVLRHAAHLGGRLRAAVTFVGSTTVLEPDGRLRGPREGLLRGLTAELDPHIELHFTNESSRLGAVLSAAADRGADLVVVGTHPRSPSGRLGVEGVGQRVATDARCSVLVVPLGEGCTGGARGP